MHRKGLSRQLLIVVLIDKILRSVGYHLVCRIVYGWQFYSRSVARHRGYDLRNDKRTVVIFQNAKFRRICLAIADLHVKRIARPKHDLMTTIATS
jgi:hypothetical protein